MSLKEEFNSLRGKTVVFTGALSAVKRKQANAIAWELGAKVRGAVSGKTDLVVVGQAAGKKLQEAALKGTNIVNEEQFFALVKQQRQAEKVLKAPKL